MDQSQLNRIPSARAMLSRLAATIVLPNAVAALIVHFALEPSGLPLALVLLPTCAALSLLLTWRYVAAPLRDLASREMQRSASVISHAMDAIITTDAEGRIRSFNPAAERIFEWRADEITGKPIELILPDESFKSYRRALAEDACDGTAPGANVLLEALAKSGRRLHAEGSFAAYGHQDGIVVNGILRDVSDRVRAEQALRVSETSFRSLIEHSPDAILVVRDAIIIYANRAAVEMLGYTGRDDLVSRAYNDLVSPEERGKRETTMELWTRPDRSMTAVDRRFMRKDGSVVETEMSAIALIFAGAPATVAIARDVTARNQMRGRILLADRMASLGTLAAGVAHEINNPLAYVQMNIQFIDEVLAQVNVIAERATRETPDAELVTQGFVEMRQAANEALEGSSRIARIVSDLSATARSDDEPSKPLDVRQVLESALRMAAKRFVGRARVVTSFAPVPPVDAPPGRLQQVFLNLLINAAQAIPEGNEAKNEVRVTTRREPGKVIVEVADTGSGIPPEDLSRVFDPFFTRQPVGGGTGLGLAVGHGIITALRGEITVESEVGRGSTFTVSLPAAVESERPTQLAKLELKSRARLSIVIVDDEPAIARGLARALGAEHAITALFSGAEALDLLLRGLKADVVLCDLIISDVSGEDIYREVKRARPELIDRFIFMTGGTFTQSTADFLGSIPNLCLQKPIDLQELRRRVAELAERVAAGAGASGTGGAGSAGGAGTPKLPVVRGPSGNLPS